MVDGQHKLSRRALLGAVCATPLIPRHPGLDPGSMNTVGGGPDAAVVLGSGLRRNDGRGRNDPWHRALARFDTARAALDAASSEPDEDLYDRLGALHETALQRLLRTPAPTLAALARKLDLALDERSGEFFGDEAAMKALKRDAQRLAASTA